MWKYILKNIQISGQKTSSDDYISPVEDDDCLDWWLKLESLLNKLAYRFSRENGRNLIDFKFVYNLSEEKLCISIVTGKQSSSSTGEI